MCRRLPFHATILILTLILTVESGCGGGAPIPGNTPASTQKPLPTINFTAQPGTITKGSSAVLSWTTSNATSVTIPGVGTFGVAGTANVSPATTTTYTATASGPNGTAQSAATVTVSNGSEQPPGPTITLTATPASIAAGASSTLSWTTTNATSVNIPGVGSFGATGSANVTPATTTTYTATANGGGGTASASATVTVTTGMGVPQFSHVVLLVEENHSYSSVIGSSSMPYLNSLASQYGSGTQYYANTHPSIGNYFMLTTGRIISNDDSYTATVTADNVVRDLVAAGQTWKSYAESLPSVGYTGGDVYPYVKHHNPFSYFSDVVNSQNQLNNLVPFTSFSSDLTNDQLPQFSFIVPNLLNDAHDGSLQQADSWLKSNIAPFIASSAFNNSLLIIVFDESFDSDTAHGGGQVVALVLSPVAKKGYQSTTFYQHQSTLRTLMEGLGLTSFPGAAASAPDMKDFF